MTLNQTTTPMLTKLHGEESSLVIGAGKTLRIETSPGGGEVLGAVVPTGKVWTVTISVDIDETDE